MRCGVLNSKWLLIDGRRTPPRVKTNISDPCSDTKLNHRCVSYSDSGVATIVRSKKSVC